MSQIRRKPAALRDLISIGRRIARHDPSAAERFLDAAEPTFNELARHPFIGWLRHFQRRPGLRSWRVDHFQDYLVFYRPIADGVEICRVLHGARDLRRLLTRRPKLR